MTKIMILLVLFFTGCTMTPPPGVSEQQANMDIYQCEQECGWYTGDADKMLIQHGCIKRCLQRKGYK